MKNEYTKRNGICYVKVRGFGEEATAIFDEQDFEKLQATGYSLWLNSKGYVAFGSSSKTFKEKFGASAIFVHRYITDVPNDKQIDHINLSKLDNRQCNLRYVNNLENSHNRRCLYRHNTSDIKGVSWHKKMQRWTANIRVHYRLIWLGDFDTKGEAEKARKEAELKYWQENKEIPQNRLRKDNVSGYAGVSFRKDKGKWYSRIWVMKKVIRLGTFERYEDAVAARKRAEEEYLSK